jgi:hyperosmotically inducible protein
MHPRRTAGAAAVLLAAVLSACDRGTSQAPTQGARRSAPAPSSTDPGRLQSAVEDTTLTAKVKAALLAADGIQATDITVETQQGIVILTGKVGDTTQVQRAAEIAQGVEGVKSVDNRLTAQAT